MSTFAGTYAKVSLKTPHSGLPGHLIFTITLAATTYVNGDLNLRSFSIPGHTPAVVKAINFSIGGSTAAYLVLYTPATTPTFAAMGTLKLFTATGAEASGSLSLVVTGHAVLASSTDMF